MGGKYGLYVTCLAVIGYGITVYRDGLAVAAVVYK